MKNIILCMMMSCSVWANAQTITTQSSCDSNSDGKVDITDVTNTANKVVSRAASETNVVTAEQLNALLSEINAKLDELKDIKRRLEYVEKAGVYSYPFDNGYEYVDLGLSVEWATCNVGASEEEESGLYFMWGETNGNTSDVSDGRIFNLANYKWMVEGQSTWQYVTKYTYEDGNTEASWYENGTYVGSTVDGVNYRNLSTLQTEDDAACAACGGSWRMPTSAEIQELLDNCTRSWTTRNNVYGYEFTASNGKSIFLPACGYRRDDALENAAAAGCYWSSSLRTEYSSNAYGLIFSDSECSVGYKGRRCGFNVRPVRK